MKTPTKLVLLATILLLPLQSASAASFDCSKAKSWSEKTICNTKQLSSLDDLLAVSYKKALTAASETTALKASQKEWLAERDTCTDVDCLKETYTSRIAELNDIIANATDTSSDSNGWYKSSAQPSLVVRDSPDVTGKKLGNVPPGGKVKVLANTGKNDSIGGRSGTWVKIEWQGKSAYAFDAFLEKLASQDTQPAQPKQSSGNTRTIEGVISSYECGDNCYLTITDKRGEDHSGLCAADLCTPWNDVAAMPSSFKNRKVKASIGTGTQYDGAGNVMGEMDAFESITLLN